MNLRVACGWVRERMIRAAFDSNVAAEEDKHAREARMKAERQHKAAVNEVDGWLDSEPEPLTVVNEGPSRERAEFLRAMGAEVAG